MIGHIQRFDQLCTKLMNIGVKLDEEDKSLLFLCSLPGSYGSLVTSLLYGKETLEYEDMVSVLRSNEQRKKLTKDRAPQEGLAIGERTGRGRGRSRGRSERASGIWERVEQTQRDWYQVPPCNKCRARPFFAVASSAIYIYIYR